MAKNLYNKVLWNSSTGDMITAGTGITAGVGTIYNSSIEHKGNMVKTTILVKLNGLRSSATADDIIGVNGSANPAHIGQYVKDKMGTLFAGQVTCLQLPTGGTADIDLYSALEGTGTEDQAITALTETVKFGDGPLCARRQLTNA